MRFYFSILILLSAFSYAQDERSFLNAPDDWRKEIIEFPLSFAPDIDLKGVEDVRFAPGWSKEGNEDFWTYAFLWYLDADPNVSKEKLEDYLKLYFDGLMELVAKGNNIDSSEVTKTTPVFYKLRSKSGKDHYNGQVQFFDAFFTKREILLNVQVLDFYCSDEQKYLTLFKLSPKDIEHDIWNSLNRITSSSKCY
ncbi:MAG: hypothetical protein AAF363_12765 [Bacteroidota bacterium]